MKLEVFKEIIALLQEQEHKIDKAYKAEVDLVNFIDPISTVVGLLIGSAFGKDSKETFDWWCYEKEWGTRKDLTMTTADGTALCETIEELYDYLVENAKDDFELPYKMTEEERLAHLKNMFGGI